MRVKLLFLTAVFGNLFLVGQIEAQPPKIKIPDIKPSGDYVNFTPETDAISITYVGFSVDPFPSDQLKNPNSFILPIRGLDKQVYKFAAVGSSKTGEQTRVDFQIDLTNSKPPIGVPDPTKPPPTTGVNYLLIVRPDGPASNAFTTIMQDDTWKQLNLTFKDKTKTEANKLIDIPAGTSLPAVFALNNGETTSTVIKIVRFPMNSQEILALKELK